MENIHIHYSDLLFLFLQEEYPSTFSLTETPHGIKIMEWEYAEGKVFIGIFTYENELIIYNFE
jgi:hypothetical protein